MPHQGSIFVGEQGSLILPHVGHPQVFDRDGKPLEKLPDPATPANHFHEWIDAALGRRDETGAPFAYAGPLTETVLLGNIVNRWPLQTFHWDSAACRFVEDNPLAASANQLLAPPYREDW